MADKVKVTKAVQAILDRDPKWIPALVNGIASPSKVAHKIYLEVLKITGTPAKSLRLDTVVKAVKIYVQGMEKVSDMDKVRKIIAESKLTLFSDLATVTVRTGQDTKQKIVDITNVVFKGDQRLFFGQGSLYTTFVFSLENFLKVKALFKPNEIIDMNTDYAGILTESPLLASYNPIDYDSYVLSLLSSQGIPLAGYMSWFTETLILLHNKDSLKAFEILKKEIDQLRK